MSEQLYPLEHFTPGEALEVERFGIFDDRPGYREDVAGGRVSVDVAALVAEARAELIRTGGALTAHRDAKRSRERIETATDALRIFGQGEAVVLRILDAIATAGASRPVRPPREARVARLVEVMHDAPYEPVMERQIEAFAGAVADADLWQPAPPANVAEYEALYYKAVEVVQGLFASAPTPGEVVRALERVGWAPIPMPAPVMDRDALASRMQNTSPAQLDHEGNAYQPMYRDWATRLLPFIGQPVSEVDAIPTTDEALWDFANDLLAAWNIEDENPPGLLEDFRDRFVARFGQPVSPRTVTTIEDDTRRREADAEALAIHDRNLG